MTAELVLFNRLTEDLGVTHGTIIVVLVLLYFVIKWAVKSAIKEAYSEITGKKTAEEIEAEKMCGLENGGEM
ncbi:hypothetical protein SAMN02910447_00772 [Ruminococcus sp. YE71]|uniref:DUF6019 family protein n=1 Tax=unclassified Ruminococcus TaxID=2608920 RepID=UPI00088BD5A4|nr:hypothetical protein SAMN02910446_00771 [Ruminococcus sp. YE78]SFW20373.1 hypothetical protein SAMN02910447_00772 [Ruminococcus sp. YE71]